MCPEKETPDPQAQLHLGLLRELGVPRGAPLTAHQDPWEGQLDGVCLILRIHPLLQEALNEHHHTLNITP